MNNFLCSKPKSGSSAFLLGLMALLFTAFNAQGQTCNHQLSYWSLNSCSPGSSYSELTASTSKPTGISSLSATILSNSGSHSCSPSQDNVGICHTIKTDCSWANNHSNAYKFSVTLSPSAGYKAVISKLTFKEAAPSNYTWTNGGSGDNDPPSKFGVRVLKNGVEVFKQIDIATSTNWRLETFDFSSDPDFTVSASAKFDFELLGYCRVDGSSGETVWDIDEIKVYGCSQSIDPCANDGGDSDGDGVCNNQDCAPNNPNLPATPGTACNDGNANTTNDKIQSDGCTCAGTPKDPDCVIGTERVVTSTKDNCGSWCGGSYAIAFGSGNCYTAESDLRFKEFNNGTATLTGKIKKGTATLNVNLTFTGKTSSAPSGSPHYDLCINNGGSGWYYYTGMTGTIGSQSVTKFGPAFQVGQGANLQENVFGASGWFSYGNNEQGDINIRLSSAVSIFAPDTDNDGICDNEDCAPNNPNIPATPGTACNDGNPNTTNDVIQSDGCSCAGTIACNLSATFNVPSGCLTQSFLIFADANDPYFPPNNPNYTYSYDIQPANTIASAFTVDPRSVTVTFNAPGVKTVTATITNPAIPNCQIVKQTTFTVNDCSPCAGQGGDSDGDGTCNNQDCAPNDPNLPAAPGTACNDGNPNTNNDVIQSDGCSCAGTPVSSGCDIVVTQDGNKITISGLTDPITSVKIITSTWQTVYQCDPWSTPCGPTVMYTVTQPGTYYVSAQSYTSGWSKICDIFETVTITNCVGGDADGDGVCDNQDCAPNNPALPAAPGTPCNDGDPNTANDVIGADGCSCAGTPAFPCVIVASLVSTQCSDSGTPNNPNDDTYTVTLKAVITDGGGWGWDLVGSNIMMIPSGSTAVAGPFLISEGPKTLTLKDHDVQNCVTTITVVPPAPCSTPQDPCVNLGGDSDGDGVCNSLDCAPNNPNLPTAPGTACNDGNPNTANDVIQSDGCSCAGTPVSSGCNVVVSSDGSKVTISGLNDPIVSVKIITSTWQTIYQCDPWSTPCGETVTYTPTQPGTYFVSAQTYSSGWSQICNIFETITIDGHDPCAAKGGDSDGDGICNNDDCAPNNPALPTTPGTACNDNNPSTVGDVIQSDGCTCAGRPLICVISGSVSDIVCNNNGTPSNPGDDTYTFKVTVFRTGDCTSTSWSGGGKTGNYNTAVTFGPYPISGGNKTITITNTEGASTTVTATAPATCSNQQVCDNVTNGGSIGGAQSGCGPFDPQPLTSVSLPSGGSGAIEYIWLSSTSGCPTMMSQSISGTNSATYDPPVLTQTTWFVRCSRRAGCTDWTIGESNCVKIEVKDCPSICADRSVTDSKECSNSTLYTFYADGLVSGISNVSNYYKVQNGKFVEYEDGTARFTGTFVNTTNSNVKFDADVLFTGRKTSGTPKSAHCSHYTLNPYNVYYYDTTEGTLTGLSAVAGGKVKITRKDAPFHVGMGANLHEANQFGASGWLNVQVLSNPTNSGVSLKTSGTYDFNWRLSGDPIACVEPPANNCNKKVLFVVGSTNLGSGDKDAKQRLVNLGFDVTVVDDGAVSLNDANGKGLVVISSTVNSGSVSGKFKSSTIPVVTWEAWIFDEMKMTGSTTSDYGKWGVTDEIKIVNASHPLASGLSGKVEVFTSSQNLSWGAPGSGAIKIAEFTHTSSKSPLFAYETGATMVGGFTAPSRRVGFFLDNFTVSKMNSKGWMLFDAAILWASNCQAQGSGRATILTFDAQLDRGQVALNWSNNTGSKNEKFVVERSADGQNFETILERSSLSADDTPKFYEDLDPLPATGDNFYRLKLVYLDGSFEYAPVRRIHISDIEYFGLFPNPARNEVNVALKGYEGREITIQVLNQFGVKVKEVTIEEADAATFQLDLNGLTNGVYSLWVFSTDRKPIGKKLIIERLY